jgi:hypothetical protein
MLFVIVRSQVTCVVTHERVCNCLYRCHSMLFMLVRSRCTYGFTHERVCNCLYRSHYMLFVLVRSRVTCVFLINECVIVYTGVILCCSCSLAAVLHVFLLMNITERVCYMCFSS